MVSASWKSHPVEFSKFAIPAQPVLIFSILTHHHSFLVSYNIFRVSSF